jgi:hypothetical protein
MIKNR